MTNPVRLGDLIEAVLDEHPDGGELEHLSDAVVLAHQLGDLGDHLVGHFVDQARRSGASWTEIGQYLGVTKQAAQKRFVPRESDELDFPEGGRLSRFTPRARNVIAAARTAAEQHGSSRVRNEHLLIGLCSEPDGLAAQALVAQGCSLDAVRAAMAGELGKAGRAKAGVRFSREAKKSLELALRAALHLGHNYIGTEHLLLGILRNDDDRVAELLHGLGVSHDGTVEWLTAELARIKAAREAG